jgi:hypothetical protein
MFSVHQETGLYSSHGEVFSLLTRPLMGDPECTIIRKLKKGIKDIEKYSDNRLKKVEKGRLGPQRGRPNPKKSVNGMPCRNTIRLKRC